jgi:hypothetical protein
MTKAIVFEVEYDTKDFDLTVPQFAFNFIFELYNFLSAAKADNDSFHEPERRLMEAKDTISRKGYPTLPNTMPKCEETEHYSDSNSSRGPPASEGARDSFDNSSVQIEITRAGYRLTQLPKDFTLLTPVSCDSRRCAR